jgi:hypothetical protein
MIIESLEWQNTLTILKEQGLSFAIAGGYARDIKHGAEPKDMDVGVFDLDVNQAQKLVDALHSKGLIKSAHHGLVEEETECSEAYEGNHILGVLTLYGKIDIILCNYNLVTGVGDWLATFDYNINQYYLDSNGKPIYFPVPYKPEGELHFLNQNHRNTERMEKRDIKTVNLAIKYGWEVKSTWTDQQGCDIAECPCPICNL